MKKFIVIVVVFMKFPLLFAQGDFMRDLYKERAEKNLELLAKDPSIRQYVSITEAGIEIYPYPGTPKPEFTLYWYEATDFLKKFQQYNYAEMLDFYDQKGSQKLRVSLARRTIDFWRFTPSSISDLAIAIDPGHFAANWHQAKQERKYVKIKGSELGLKEDIEFFEAELTMATALILKDTLEKLGARKVMITRESGVSAVGKDFDTWFKEDFVSETKRLKESGELKAAFADKLIAENKPFPAFKYVYSYIDFVNRSRRINEFMPDVTFVMHYNADEAGERQENGYWPVTDNNYSMVFVPGAFMYGELMKKDARIEFLRLLLTPDLEESIRLSGFLIDNLQKNLGVNPIDSKSSAMLNSSSLPTGKEGVFSRNLYLTRAVESPVAYIEFLFQDNEKEAILLSDKSIRIGNLVTSKRVQQVAYSALESIQDWMHANAKSNQEWEDNGNIVSNGSR